MIERKYNHSLAHNRATHYVIQSFQTIRRYALFDLLPNIIWSVFNEDNK